MNKDIRETALFKEIESLCKTLRQPGTGQISDATEVSVSPDGQRAVFAAALMDRLEGTPPTRIALTDLSTGDTRVLTNGVTSVLAIYPEEGHGIRKFPAVIDYVARVVNWFQTYMPAKKSSTGERA